MPSRPPCPALRPFVKLLWTAEPRAHRGILTATRELALPSMDMHVVLRLSEEPIRLFDSLQDDQPRTYSHAAVGGMRTAYYVREAPPWSHSIGAQLAPGASLWLFGARPDELANRHIPLDELWGHAAADARDRLMECRSAHERLDVFESMLLARKLQPRGLHPAVATALVRFAGMADVHQVAADSGYSHRRFIELFRQTVGLAPKSYCRVLRLHRTLEALADTARPSLAEVALSAGFSDQSHLNREFRAMTGVSPARYKG